MSCSLQSCFRWRDDLRFSLRLGLRAVDLVEIKCRKKKKYTVLSRLCPVFTLISYLTVCDVVRDLPSTKVMTNDSFSAYEPVCQSRRPLHNNLLSTYCCNTQCPNATGEIFGVWEKKKNPPLLLLSYLWDCLFHSVSDNYLVCCPCRCLARSLALIEPTVQLLIGYKEI